VQARRFLNVKEEYEGISQPQKWYRLKRNNTEALESNKESQKKRKKIRLKRNKECRETVEQE
jgi:hypothetical protein